LISFFDIQLFTLLIVDTKRDLQYLQMGPYISLFNTL